MTVERGRDWGRIGPLPTGAPIVRTDAEARAVVTAARREGVPMPAIGLCGGDLWRTLGGTAGRDPSSQDAVAVVVDVGSVLLDGRQHWFVAHLVARRSWWRGRTFAAMNAQFLGTWDVAPRAHPGDGRLDVLDADLDLRARLGARRRLRHGTHVPHPGIREQRLTAWQGTFEPALPVRLDGEPAGTVHNVSLRVEPASLTVHL